MKVGGAVIKESRLGEARRRVGHVPRDSVRRLDEVKYGASWYFVWKLILNWDLQALNSLRLYWIKHGDYNV